MGVESRVGNMGSKSRIVVNQGMTKFANKADSIQNIDQGLIDDALTVMDVEIGTSESYRILGNPENVKTYSGLGLNSGDPLEHQTSSKLTAKLGATNINNKTGLGDMVPGAGGQDESFYSASNTIEHASSGFNKTKEKLKDSLFDSSYHERVFNITKKGHEHKVGRLKDRNGNLYRVSPTSVTIELDKMQVHSMSSSQHNPHNNLSKDA